MSKEVVSLKGNQNGLTIYVEQEATLSEMMDSLENKLIQAKGYFDHSKMMLSFSGKELSDIEKYTLIEIIKKNSKMEIISVLNSEKEKNIQLDNQVRELKRLLSLSEKKGISFHHGTLRSGQSVSVKNSLVILGDVNNGAIVNAGGSVIILGKLRGVVNCGLSGQIQAFIFALEMKPTLLQINNVYGRFEEAQESEISTEPMIAYAQIEQIAMEPISRSINKDLEL